MLDRSKDITVGPRGFNRDADRTLPPTPAAGENRMETEEPLGSTRDNVKWKSRIEVKLVQRQNIIKVHTLSMFSVIETLLSYV